MKSLLLIHKGSETELGHPGATNMMVQMNTRMLLKLKGNNNNRVRNLDSLFIMQGSRRGYNLNIMIIPAMFAEGYCVLISPAANRTTYNNIQMCPDMSQDGIQIRICKMTQMTQVIFTFTWSIQTFWVCLSWNH